MFNIKVSFDNTMYNPEELQSAKNDLMNGVSLEDLEEMYDVRLALAAVIECAKDLGWDMDEYLQKKQIEETMYLYFAFGETQPKVWRGFMMMAALNYIQEKICA